MLDKRITVFDCETTGLINKKKPLDQQPYIVEFAAITLEHHEGIFNIIERHNAKYKPGVSIPKNVSKIHGIYDDDVKDKSPISRDIQRIRLLLEDADILVAHNGSFDFNCIWTELKRSNIDKGFFEAVKDKLHDTMLLSKDIVQAKNKNGHIKKPNLQELHQYLFGYAFDHAHSAMADVMATAKCYVEITKRGLITLVDDVKT